MWLASVWSGQVMYLLTFQPVLKVIQSNVKVKGIFHTIRRCSFFNKKKQTINAMLWPEVGHFFHERHLGALADCVQTGPTLECVQTVERSNIQRGEWFVRKRGRKAVQTLGFVYLWVKVDVEDKEIITSISWLSWPRNTLCTFQIAASTNRRCADLVCSLACSDLADECCGRNLMQYIFHSTCPA